MRKYLILLLGAALAWPTALAAQEQEKEEGPTWWAVFTEQVSPAMADEYEAVSEEMMPLIRENAAEDMEYYTLSSAEAGYMYAIPMASMADFMTLNASWNAMIDKIGRDAWDEMSARSDAAVTHRTGAFFVERSDLSYEPASPRLTFEESRIRHYDWLYPIPGKEREMVESMKKWVELYEANGVTTGFTTYQAVTGENLPAFVVGTRAASPADYLADGERIDEQLGDADDELWAETKSLMRDFKHYNAWVRPELSLMPEE